MITQKKIKMLTTVGILYVIVASLILQRPKDAGAISVDNAVAPEVQQTEIIIESINNNELSPFWSSQIARWNHLITKREFDANLLAAIMHVESGGRPDAISSAGATGLMQVMPQSAIAGRPTTQQLLNPEVNVNWGIRILREYTDQFGGDIRLGLGAYYMGPSRANTDGGRWYADKVLSLYARSLLHRDDG